MLIDVKFRLRRKAVNRISGSNVASYSNISITQFVMSHAVCFTAVNLRIQQRAPSASRSWWAALQALLDQRSAFHEEKAHLSVSDLYRWPAKRAEPGWTAKIPRWQIISWGLLSRWRKMNTQTERESFSRCKFRANRNMVFLGKDALFSTSLEPGNPLQPADVQRRRSGRRYFLQGGCGEGPASNSVMPGRVGERMWCSTPSMWIFVLVIFGSSASAVLTDLQCEVWDS